MCKRLHSTRPINLIHIPVITAWIEQKTSTKNLMSMRTSDRSEKYK